MRPRHAILAILSVAAALVCAPRAARAYSVLLPESVPADPPLPYVAEQDHYGGPATLQMVLNACPVPAARHLVTQDALYASILARDAEPAKWFSDPAGMRGALSDPALAPCGHWSDFSGTDRGAVLGKLLYFMDTMKYLMPVSVGSGEHWVAVIGFQTDVKPPHSGAVTLQSIFFYDPLPGGVAAMWVSGAAWTSSADYWGVPQSRAGSAWNGKYLAVIEPPTATVVVRAPKWIVAGSILPPDRIQRAAAAWLREARTSRPAGKPFEALGREIAADPPLLVKGPEYSYYIVPLRDPRLLAIFNAYDGSFEELRVAAQPLRLQTDARTIKDRLQDSLKARKLAVVEAAEPELRWAPEARAGGRFAPVWITNVTTRDAAGRVQRIPAMLDLHSSKGGLQ